PPQTEFRQQHQVYPSLYNPRQDSQTQYPRQQQQTQTYHYHENIPATNNQQFPNEEFRQQQQQQQIISTLTPIIANIIKEQISISNQQLNEQMNQIHQSYQSHQSQMSKWMENAIQTISSNL